MKILLAGFLVGLALTSASGQPAPAQKAKKEKGRRIEVLFLGDNGHHQPSARVPQLMAALGPKGINITYTDDPDDLNSATLKHYDALLLYANHDSITPQQSKALLGFVASGKGFIPVHCASFCFRNDPQIVRLMGGQFWRHTWDTIQPVWVKPDHPAIAGTTPFKTVDETYLHTKLEKDNEVLTTRLIGKDQEKDRPDQKTEPYTWVRKHGKGRIFYTAYGHDEKTWSQPGFHHLVEKGILWAVNEEARKAHAALNPAQFVYREAKLPNYEQRPGPQLQQLPLSPEESVKHIQVPAGFTLDVFAHEPNVMHPIALSWDERGRLYVLITKDYPNERKAEGGDDYILICEDTDSDGKADKFTRFAEGLSIPTGIVFANGGVIVAQAPHMLFLKDTDGDDKADVKQILFSGFGTFDTHAGPSSLHYGFDNWIYGAVGYSGFKGKFGKGDSLNFGQALFRFRPDGSDMELLTRTSNNTWGLGFNEAGDLFGSTANNAHGWYMAIPNRYYGASKVDNGSRSTDTHKGFQPITGKVRQVDVFGGFTAAAGHQFYTARSFPRKFWNRAAFVAEPTGHLLHINYMKKHGTDFRDKLGFNLLAGADEWVSPVFAQVGPDGAVWVADWYSYIIQHNPTPKGFGNGPGNAYQTDLRDYTHGRIYRVGWKDAPPYQPVTLSKEKPGELLKALRHPNMLWRLHAQRLLVERQKKDVVPELIRLVSDRSVDAVGLNTGVIHALWTLHGLGEIKNENPAVFKAALSALRHPSAPVRKNAVQVLPKIPETGNALIDQKLMNDPDELVVLHTLLAFSEIPLTPSIENAVLTRLSQASEVEDRWLPDAFAVTLNAHEGALRKKILFDLQSKAGSSTTQGEAAHSHHHTGKPSAGEATNLPDLATTAELAVTDIRISPEPLNMRDPARITVDITNLGGREVPKENVPTVVVNIEGAGISQSFISRQLTRGIGAGQTVQLTEGNNGPWKSSFGFTAEQAGKVTVTAIVDTEQSVPERDESSNNRLSRTFEVIRPANLTSFALERAVRGYTSYATGGEIIGLLKMASSPGNNVQNALLRGVISGWDAKRTESAAPGDARFLTELQHQIPASLLDKYTALLKSFGLDRESGSKANTLVVQIRAVREEMKFNLSTFTVKAGQPVELVFENPDAMPHNLVIGKPGTLEKIGSAADLMITQQDAGEKNYVPSIPEIIAASPLVNPNERYRLQFVAPETAGDYPFTCTFPGHWRLMSGHMKVVAGGKAD